MEIRMALKGRYDYIENEDIVVLDEKAVDFYKQKFPMLEIEKELNIIAHFFRFFPNQRAESKRELNRKIENLLTKAKNGKGLNERMLEQMVGKNYVPLSDYYKLCEVFGG